MDGDPVQAEPTFRGPAPAESTPVDGLADRLDGDVRADAYTRHLFATDASLFRAVPIAVVFPRHRDDVVATVRFCAARSIPVLPRGAGTSLAGQTVNTAVVIDFSRHMADLIEVDVASRRARVQPGLVMAEFDAALADDGLQFAPDPAWSNQSTVGGAIGNNSSGAHSLAYGPTADYLHTVEVVLADGTLATFGPTDVATIRDRADPDGDTLARIYATVDRLARSETDTIEAALPDLERNVAGYHLKALVDPDDAGRINLARLFAASEGTLGVVVEATVDLVVEPAAVGTLMLSYATYEEAMTAVPALLEAEPAAVETLDEPVLSVAREHPNFAAVARLPAAGAEGVLLVEIFDETVDEVTARLEALAERFGPPDGTALEAAIATDDTERARFWQLRKSSLPLLLSETTDAKHVAFVEDAAVPPEQLASFVAGFRSILDAHGSSASFYGHAGAGVLHVRPLVDTVSSEGREEMRAIAEAAFELTVDHGGTISGEHGDGRVRTEWMQRQYGDDILDLFRTLKAAFDPGGLLNPGPIVGDVVMDEGHRIAPDQPGELPFEPTLAWDNPNGMRGMIDLCHGCGGCRSSQAVGGGIMCPTFRASGEEIAATRGRANLLREAMRGHLDPEVVFDPRFEAEVLSLCIGCKGCLRDCPSGVDMATLKAELRHQRHRRRGATRRERLFGDLPKLARWGALAAPMSNWMTAVPGVDRVLERTLGIAAERDPPRFARNTFTEWASGRLSSPATDDRDRVLVVADPYTNYFEPDTGRATVRVLEAAGARVFVPDDLPPPGRAAYSQGFVERARDHASAMVEALTPYVDDGWSVVVPEPSAAAMLQADYQHLLGRGRAAAVADATYTPLGYLDVHDFAVPLDPSAERFVIHEHCHQRSIGNAGVIERVLASHGYRVETVDAGCCGMAGSFGYEVEHQEMSAAIAAILVDTLRERSTPAVLAPGTSCRAQLTDFGDGWPLDHPISRLAADLA